MKIQIEQLAVGYVLNTLGEDGESERQAFQSVQGVLLTAIEIFARKDPAAKTATIRQTYDARIKHIVEALRISGKPMTVNQVAVRAADRQGVNYSERFQVGVGVALANANNRPNSMIERVGRNSYRYKGKTDDKTETAT